MHLGIFRLGASIHSTDNNNNNKKKKKINSINNDNDDDNNNSNDNDDDDNNNNNNNDVNLVTGRDRPVKISTPLATLPGPCDCRVTTATGWPGVSIL